MKPSQKLRNFIGLGIIVLLSSACSSELMIQRMYDDLGDSFVDEIHTYADFDEHQSQTIENVAGDLHHWHRTTQLPVYANILREIWNASASGLLSQREYIDETFMRVERARQDMENAPWPRLGGLFSTLSDSQIAQIEATLNEEIRDMERELKRMQSRRGEGKLVRERRKEMEALFTDVLDVPLSKSQKLRIEAMAEQWQGDPRLELRLESQWNERFIDLLKRLNSGSVAVDTLMDHLLASSTLLESAAPEQMESNRRLIVDGLHDIVNSMDAEQHQRMRLSLNRYADLIEGL